MSLTGKQRRALRALGHHLEPTVMVGKDGVTDALVEAAAQALEDHELIKLKVGENSPIDRHDAADELAARTSSEVAQVLGRTVLLFRRRAEDPEIALPGMPLPPKPAAEREQAGRGSGAPKGRPEGRRPSGGRPPPSRGRRGG